MFHATIGGKEYRPAVLALEALLDVAGWQIESRGNPVIGSWFRSIGVNWVVNVFQLTAAQQLLLDHRPQLSCSPDEIIATLNLIPASSQDGLPPALQ